MNDGQLFLVGFHQLFLAVPYLRELIDEDDNLSFHYAVCSRNMVMIKVQSGCINSKSYNIFIDYACDQLEILYSEGRYLVILKTLDDKKLKFMSYSSDLVIT